MFESFSEVGIKAIMTAKKEARRLGHNRVGTEQLLLGVVLRDEGALSILFPGITFVDFRITVDKIIGRGSGFVSVEIPFTPRAKTALEFAVEIAKEHIQEVWPLHILAGILKVGEGTAFKVLAKLGVYSEELLDIILDYLNAGAKLKGYTRGSFMVQTDIGTIIFQYAVPPKGKLEDNARIINISMADNDALIPEHALFTKNFLLLLRNMKSARFLEIKNTLTAIGTALETIRKELDSSLPPEPAS